MVSQVINGKAFEWAVGAALTSNHHFSLVNDDIAKHNQQCYNHASVSDNQRKNYKKSAALAIKHILVKEQLKSSQGTVRFLADKRGQEGDVRDLVILTTDKEVGISCKTNHDAFKHSRLSKNNDFVKRWNLDNQGCSKIYFDSIEPVFNELAAIRKESNRLKKWSELEGKANRFFWPILNAFEAEIRRIEHPEMCQNFIKYIVGNKDFYKVISSRKKVLIQAFNLAGTLNTSKQPLPDKIDFIKDKNGDNYSKTISFNKGWVFNFRIHNASSRVEASLKFDVTALALSYKHYTHHIDY